MNEQELQKVFEAGPDGVIEVIAKMAATMEAFRRSMVVASLYGGRDNPSFAEGIKVIKDAEFLRDLEHFGAALADRARAQRTKAEARRMADGYSRGA